MTLGASIQAWRLSRKLGVATLAEKTGLPAASLEAIESGELDPPASALASLATALGIPVSWLYSDPRHIQLLTTDPDGEPVESPALTSPDPVTERVLHGLEQERELYVLLTALLQSGEPKLLRAAEASLRSLVKQSRQATVPWQSRPPGHFEPPSD
ncbi:MAG TPA: helix-turn-helix transcriptional regulator [Nitrospiraceae bacterium]|jgi:transcriptional regulator with XRE-family HTH domain|nr:helix-turn-helix transcriptional regulator [Nitrospiraceae bacterium]